MSSPSSSILKQIPGLRTRVVADCPDIYDFARLLRLQLTPPEFNSLCDYWDYVHSFVTSFLVFVFIVFFIFFRETRVRRCWRTLLSLRFGPHSCRPWFVSLLLSFRLFDFLSLRSQRSYYHSELSSAPMFHESSCNNHLLIFCPSYSDECAG